tara:strand:+ start:525 stop:689 length:165 start_codon:yes stop_codon:yes gene_type:complete
MEHPVQRLEDILPVVEVVLFTVLVVIMGQLVVVEQVVVEQVHRRHLAKQEHQEQ